MSCGCWMLFKSDEWWLQQKLLIWLSVDFCQVTALDKNLKSPAFNFEQHTCQEILCRCRSDNWPLGQVTISWSSTTRFFPLSFSLEAVSCLPGNHSSRSLNQFRCNLTFALSEPIAVVGEMFLAGRSLSPVFLKRWYLMWSLTRNSWSKNLEDKFK